MNEGAGAEPYGYPTTNDGGDVDALLACAALADVKDAEGVMGAVVDAVQMAEEQEEAEDQWRSEMPAHAGLVDAACCKELCCRRACTQLKTRTKEIVVEMAGLQAAVEAARKQGGSERQLTLGTAAARMAEARRQRRRRRTTTATVTATATEAAAARPRRRCARRQQGATPRWTQRCRGARGCARGRRPTCAGRRNCCRCCASVLIRACASAHQSACCRPKMYSKVVDDLDLRVLRPTGSREERNLLLTHI